MNMIKSVMIHDILIYKSCILSLYIQLFKSTNRSPLNMKARWEKILLFTNITITILLITSCLFFQTQITCTSSLNKRADISNCDHKRNQSFFFMPPRSKIGGHIVFVLSVILSFHSVIPSFCNSVILSFRPPLWNFNLANNFWIASARVLIFYMNIPCGEIFL